MGTSKTSRMFSEFLPYAGLIEEGTVITKDGFVFRTCAVRSRDLFFETESGVISALRHLTNTFRFMGEGWVIYVDSHRKSTSDLARYFAPDAPWAAQVFEQERYRSLGEMFYTEFYITVGYAVNNGSKSDSILFSNTGGESDTIRREVSVFMQLTDDIFGVYESIFRDVVVLGSDDILTYLHSLHGDPHPVVTPELPFYLDVYLSDQRFVPDTITKLDDEYVVTASVSDWPGETHAGLMSRLMEVPLEFRITTRYIMLGAENAKKEIKDFRRTHFQKRKGLGAMFTEAATGSETQLEDTEALSLTAEGDQALAEMSSGTINFGKLSTVIVVRDADYKTARARIQSLKKIVNEQGFVCKEETFGNPMAFLATLPGNMKYFPRMPLISTRNLSHLYPLSDKWEGEFSNEHMKSVTGVDFPHVVTKTGNSVFYLNLNVGDVGHTFIIGPTGSGKSILGNTLALQYLRYPGAKVYFFDVDRSSQWPCMNVGGTFFDVGGDGQDLRLNPFSKIDQKPRRVWLSGFLASFFRMKGITITPEDESEIYEALGSMTDMPMQSRSFRAFRDLVQHKGLRAALDPFIDGEYSDVFTNEDDDFQDSVWTTFEMRSLMSRSHDLVTFVVGYLFHVLESKFDGTPALLILDEAWLFLQNEQFSEMIRDFLKTLRKKNVYVILATQEIQDARGSLFSTIINACQTKILLPNPMAEVDYNYDLYQQMGLSDADISVVASAEPKRDYIYISPKGKQVFSLRLNREQLAILKGPVRPVVMQGSESDGMSADEKEKEGEEGVSA